VSFDQVLIEPEEVIAQLGTQPTLRSALRGCLSQLMLSHMFIGIAQGALTEAREYTRTVTRPWPGTTVTRASEEPMIVHQYGELWIQLRAAASLAREAADTLDRCWASLASLTREQVGECTIAVNMAKVLSTRVGLDLTSRIFEVMGARATAGRLGFDRYWRNLRTLTLHDPVEMRLRAVGNWYLNDQLPIPEVTS
jgi:alkylation response protein AidB-like acyl-CoA dehydrogenase